MAVDFLSQIFLTVYDRCPPTEISLKHTIVVRNRLVCNIKTPVLNLKALFHFISHNYIVGREARCLPILQRHQGSLTFLCP